MARFVTFPGTAGSYASTDDVNLLDADTGNLAQSIGAWVLGGTGALAHQPVAGEFGSMELLASAGSPGTFMRAQNNTTYAVTEQDYTFSALVANESASARGLAIRIVHSIDGIFNIDMGSQPVGSQRVAHTFALSAGNITEMRIQPDNGDVVDGDTWDFSKVVLAAGTSTEFVPSLRIVGDLDVRYDAAPTSWTPGTDYENPMAMHAGGAAWFYVATRTSGLLTFNIRGVEKNSTAAVTLSDGERASIKTLGFAVSGISQFFVNEVQLGSDVAGDPFTTPADGTPLIVGARAPGTAGNFDGDVYSASMRDGIDGPIVAVFNPDDIAI